MREANFVPWGWEGFVPESSLQLSSDTLLIRLSADPNTPPRCHGCGASCGHVHDTQLRRIRDRDLFEYRVWLEVPVRRVICRSCGVGRERIDWLLPHARLTERLRRHAEVLLQLMPIKHVSHLTGLHWHTLKQIDKDRLTRTLPAPDPASLRYLAMDEFALFKGHRYATVVINAENRQVVWVGEGRSRRDIRPFFAWLGDHAQQIEAVVMDMNSAMDLEVKAHCSRARVVYDLFHVIAKFGREVIDRVRVDEANRLRDDKPGRKVIKQSRWLLLRNRGNLQDNQRVRLDELLAANHPLMLVYLMKEQLKIMWYAPSEKEARRRWRQWYEQAMESAVEPLIRFAKRLKPYLDGIVSSATYRLNTSVLEGINNRIKVIKRMAYGFRDNEYFFLKIKAAFPGLPR